MKASDKVTLEICCSDPVSLEHAVRCGVERVELCCAIDCGGLTPPTGMIRRAAEAAIPSVNVLVRPRPGGFVYNDPEIEAMCRDIEEARRAGATGVVCGCTRMDGLLDIRRMRRLQAAAQGMEFVLHRCVDEAPAALEANLERAVGLGLQRILTSGGAATAEKGRDAIRSMVQQAAGRITIMAGGGVNALNAPALAAHTGTRALHSTAHKPRNYSLADPGLFGEPEWGSYTDYNTLRELQRVISEMV